MVLLKTRAICSLGIYMNVIKDSVHYWMIYFVSRETDIWVERGKKVRSCRKNIYFKETTTVEWIKANCALKITIFRYFAFFLFLFFLLFIHYKSFLCTIFSGTHVRTVRTGSYALEICSYTTQYGIRSLSYTGPKLWNSLSNDVKIPVFVNISRILWLMVIILLLIPNVLRSYYLKRLFN